MAQESTAIIPLHETYQGPALLMPLADPAQARAAIAAYEALKAAIIRPDDIQQIKGARFLRKSFWRRIARFFGLSVELVREERLEIDGEVAYRVVYRAIAPNGQGMDGDGMMVYGEKGQTIEHNIRAIAHTRAKNRAISDLVGGGEVSAEEMPDEDERRARRPTPTQTRAAAPRPTPARAQPRVVEAKPANDPHVLPPDVGANRTDGRKVTMSSLRLRLRQLGASSVAHADRMCREAIGKTWEQATEADSANLEAWIIAKEAAKAIAEDQPVEELDLAQIDIPALVP